jgi:hypothetical protein
MRGYLIPQICGFEGAADPTPCGAWRRSRVVGEHRSVDRVHRYANPVKNNLDDLTTCEASVGIGHQHRRQPRSGIRTALSLRRSHVTVPMVTLAPTHQGSSPMRMRDSDCQSVRSVA